MVYARVKIMLLCEMLDTDEGKDLNNLWTYIMRARIKGSRKWV